jgi:hypothetical protein
MSDLPGTPRRDVDPSVIQDQLEKLTAQVARLMEYQQAPEEAVTPARQRPKCFIVMPFGVPDLEDLYNEFILPVLDGCKLDCARGDDIFGSNVVMDDVKGGDRHGRLSNRRSQRAESERVLRSWHCAHSGEAGTPSFAVNRRRAVRSPPSPCSSL